MIQVSSHTAEASLWRHDDGMLATWEMNGGDLFQTHAFGAVSNHWQIRGTGEFELG